VLQKISNKQGISSLELAVVLALIAIMATMTIPYLGSWLKHYRVVGASRDVVSTLQEARLKAISDNLQWRVVFDQNNDTYWLQQGDKLSGSSSWTTQGGTKSLPKGVVFTNSGGTDASGQFSIAFSPSGTSNNHSIYLKGETGERYRITTLQTTGRIHIYVWNGSWVAT